MSRRHGKFSVNILIKTAKEKSELGINPKPSMLYCVPILFAVSVILKNCRNEEKNREKFKARFCS